MHSAQVLRIPKARNPSYSEIGVFGILSRQNTVGLLICLTCVIGSYRFRGLDPVKDGTVWRVLPSLMLGVLRVVSQSVRVGLVRIVMEPETRYIR